MNVQTTAGTLAVLLALSLATSCGTTPSAAPPAATSAPSQPAAAPTQPPRPTSVPTSAPKPTAAPTVAPKAALPVANWDEFSFDQVVTAADQSSQVMKMAYKKGKARIEVSAMGQSLNFIADPDEKVAYMWSPGQNQALKMPYDQFQEQAGNTPDPRELSKDAAQGSLVGTETVDGKQCDVYVVEGSTATVKVWVWKDNGFPLQSELKTPEGTVKSEFKNVKLGGVADDLFQLPAGMQVMDVSNMPGVPGGPGGTTPGSPGGMMPQGVPVPGR